MNIVLVEPEIPQNTGNIARTCAATGAKLHLIKPLGFVLDDKHLKRAGLDYWNLMEYTVYENWQDFCARNPDANMYFLSTKAPRDHAAVQYRPDDYLVFGMPDELAMDNMRLFAMKPKESSALANENGFLFYQAHPFRNGMTVCRPDILYGIEVHNGHPGHDSRNDIALEWAEKYGLHKISGSDCHFAEGVGKAGIITREDILTDEALVNVLKSGNYELI